MKNNEVTGKGVSRRNGTVTGMLLKKGIEDTLAFIVIEGTPMLISWEKARRMRIEVLDDAVNDGEPFNKDVVLNILNGEKLDTNLADCIEKNVCDTCEVIGALRFEEHYTVTSECEEFYEIILQNGNSAHLNKKKGLLSEPDDIINFWNKSVKTKRRISHEKRKVKFEEMNTKRFNRVLINKANVQSDLMYTLGLPSAFKVLNCCDEGEYASLLIEKSDIDSAPRAEIHCDLNEEGMLLDFDGYSITQEGFLAAFALQTGY